MEKKKLYEFSLFIFRRDMRIYDNTALINASNASKKIIPAFLFDERQIHKKTNPYFSSNCVQFMLESIVDLNSQLNSKLSKLFLFYGDIYSNLENFLAKNKGIQAVYVNQDYTPYSFKRDNEIKNICTKFKVDFHSYEDLMLTDLYSVMTPKGDFFKIYTPYCQAAMLHQVKLPDGHDIKNFINETEFTLLSSGNKETQLNLNSSNSNDQYENLIFKQLNNCDMSSLLEFFDIQYNSSVGIKGGRENGLSIIKNFKIFKDYAKTRQLVKIPSTRLSAYIKFGCISIREVYEAIKKIFGNEHELIKQLQWRDFFMKITYFYPHVIGNSFKPECDYIKWQAKPEHIEAWKNGATGFPIVDSAMRCLNKTGFIHNKLRTMVCSFLVKDVLADWRIGEQYFATILVDYDISLNNGGWQWTSSTGTDPRGEARIYNPVIQSKKLDPYCEFIFHWIPELRHVKVDHIHDWEKYYIFYKEDKINYPAPIFSHYEQRDKAFQMFQDCKIYKKIPQSQEGKTNYNDTFKNFYSNKQEISSAIIYDSKILKKPYGDIRSKDYSKNTTFGNSSHQIIEKALDNNFSYKKLPSNNSHNDKLIPQSESNNKYDEIIKQYDHINLHRSNKNKKNNKKQTTTNNNSSRNNFLNIIYGAKNNPENKENGINLLEHLAKK